MGRSHARIPHRCGCGEGRQRSSDLTPRLGTCPCHGGGPRKRITRGKGTFVSLFRYITQRGCMRIYSNFCTHRHMPECEWNSDRFCFQIYISHAYHQDSLPFIISIDGVFPGYSAEYNMQNIFPLLLRSYVLKSCIRACLFLKMGFALTGFGHSKMEGKGGRFPAHPPSPHRRSLSHHPPPPLAGTFVSIDEPALTHPCGLKSMVPSGIHSRWWTLSGLEPIYADRYPSLWYHQE